MDRKRLGAVLSAARERISPHDVGLPAGTRRRTPGLRREEVARLAGISVDYVSRLEQGRGAHPSASVVASLARALRMDRAESDHLFTLAGLRTPLPTEVPSDIRPSVRRLLDRFEDLPALLIDAKGTVLAWNALAVALLGDYSAIPLRERNMYVQRYVGGHSRVHPQPASEESLVGELKAAAARYPDDEELAWVVAQCRRDERFARLWRDAAPAQRVTDTKTVVHPELGEITLDCDTLLVPGADQKIIVYSAAPGSPAAQSLALLRVIGTQRLTPSDA